MVFDTLFARCTYQVVYFVVVCLDNDEERLRKQIKWKRCQKRTCRKRFFSDAVDLEDKNVVCNDFANHHIKATPLLQKYAKIDFYAKFDHNLTTNTGKKINRKYIVGEIKHCSYTDAGVDEGPSGGYYIDGSKIDVLTYFEVRDITAVIVYITNNGRYYIPREDFMFKGESAVAPNHDAAKERTGFSMKSHIMKKYSIENFLKQLK